MGNLHGEPGLCEQTTPHPRLLGQLPLEQFVIYWAATWKFQGALKNVSTKFSSALDARWRVSNVQEYFDLEPISKFSGSRPFTHLRQAFAPDGVRVMASSTR